MSAELLALFLVLSSGLFLVSVTFVFAVIAVEMKS